MKKLATLVMALVVALVFSGTLFAAGAEEKTEEGTMSTPQGLPEVQGAEPLRAPIVETDVLRKGEPVAVPRADAIIGLAVLDDEGRQLGKVEDLTLSDDGRIGYLVISRGGILGFGSELCAIPWEAANARIHERALIVGLSKERFESAPTFESWDELGKGGYEQQVRAYYGEQSGSMGTDPGKMDESGKKTDMPASESETGSESKQY